MLRAERLTSVSGDLVLDQGYFSREPGPDCRAKNPSPRAPWGAVAYRLAQPLHAEVRIIAPHHRYAERCVNASIILLLKAVCILKREPA